MKPPLLFCLLSDPVRWRLVTALGRSDWLVHELAEHIHQPLNLVSYHLSRLKTAGLVHERRSSLDRRARYCSLDAGRLRDLFAGAGKVLPGRFALAGTAGDTAQPSLRVLFLCTHNAARSQMAEGLLRAAAPSRWHVASAGSAPMGVHPLAISTLSAYGVDISQQTSKTVTQLRLGRVDLVITLCDRVRAEAIRVPGRPKWRHWSLPDPLGRSRRAQPQAFAETARALNERVGWLLADAGRQLAVGIGRE